MLPKAFVHHEINAGSTRSRHLEQSGTAGTSASSTTVRTIVKSQEKCGSCWAFAATDAIETAVAIAANQSQAIALSPQQLLSCSNSTTEQTFTYCWAKSNPSGSSWVTETIKW